MLNILKIYNNIKPIRIYFDKNSTANNIFKELSRILNAYDNKNPANLMHWKL